MKRHVGYMQVYPPVVARGEDAALCGTPEALRALRRAIDEALECGRGEARVHNVNGDAYTIAVRLDAWITRAIERPLESPT